MRIFEKKRIGRTLPWLFFLAGSVISVFPRTFRADTDPPPFLAPGIPHESMAVYTDGQAYTLDSRNLSQFGRLYPYIDTPPFSGFLFSPIMGCVSFFFYKLNGINHYSAALPGLFFSLVSAFALFIFFGKNLRGAAASIFVLSSFPLSVFSRTPLAENASICMLVLALLFLIKKKTFLAGIFTASAVLFGKIHAVSFLPAAIVFLTVKNKKALISYFAGTAVVAAFWFTFLYLPFKDLFNSYFLSGVQSVTENQKMDLYLFFFRIFGAGMPDLTFSTPFILFSGFLTAVFISRQKKIGDIQHLALCWLISLIFFYAVFSSYRPARFLLYFVYAAAVLFSSFGEYQEEGVLKKRRCIIPLVILSLFFSYQFSAFSLRIVKLPLLIVSFALSAAIIILTGYSNRKTVRFTPCIIATICLLHFTYDNYRLISWLIFPTRSAVGASLEIETITGEKALIAGSAAPALTLGTGIKSLAAFDWMIDSSLIEKFGVTHLIVGIFDSPSLSDYLSRNAIELRPFLVGGDCYMFYLIGNDNYLLTDYEKACLFFQEKALDSANFYLRKHHTENFRSSSAWLLGAMLAQTTGNENLVQQMVSEGAKQNPSDAFLTNQLNYQTR